MNMTAQFYKEFCRGLSFLSGLLFGMIVALGALFLASEWVYSATYNVMFNNVEQGPNSTANPTLQVSGSDVKKNPGVGAVPEVKTDLSPPAPQPEAQSVAQAPEPIDPEGKQKLPWRMEFLGQSTGFGTAGLGKREDRVLGGSLGISYFPIRDLGITLKGGLTQTSDSNFYWGGDLEFVPVRVGLFGQKDFLQTGLILGASTIGKSDDYWGSVHGGVRASVHFAERFGILAGIRTNLSDRNVLSYTMAEAGLTVRF